MDGETCPFSITWKKKNCWHQNLIKVYGVIPKGSVCNAYLKPRQRIQIIPKTKTLEWLVRKSMLEMALLYGFAVLCDLSSGTQVYRSLLRIAATVYCIMYCIQHKVGWIPQYTWKAQYMDKKKKKNSSGSQSRVSLFITALQFSKWPFRDLKCTLALFL